MQTYQDAGHFRAGSIGPKVEAALRFARAGGASIIASLLDSLHALNGTAGTWIMPDAPATQAGRTGKSTQRTKPGTRTSRNKK